MCSTLKTKRFQWASSKGCFAWQCHLEALLSLQVKHSHVWNMEFIWAFCETFFLVLHHRVWFVLQGNCLPDNLCDRGYFGPGCSATTPQLFNPPTVQSNNCSGAVLHWPMWVSGRTGNGTGDAPVKYLLEQQQQPSSGSGGAWRLAVNGVGTSL